MPPPTWTPPSEFDEYRLVRRLGHGSMGQVWLAHDLLLDRRVAIKFLGTLTERADLRERFLTEARAIARLTHPNVVTVHRVGTLEQQPYMVSELIEGESLDRVQKPVPNEQALRLAVDLARGLAAAHRAGLLHRDVKPANAMVTRDGVAKLLDFGLAKFSVESDAPVVTPTPRTLPSGEDPEATFRSPRELQARLEADGPSLTREGEIVGTPLYLAPECWHGAPASRRSDVYSLGALLYELCAGQAPVRFLPEGKLGTAFDARPLTEVAPQTEPRLAATIDRCLAREPQRRFSDGEELREVLERLSAQRPDGLPEGNPYRGLAAFEGEHRALFFGRASEVRAASDRLRGAGLVVVAGESGVGKSSLCRAGVLPAVVAGALGEGRAWRAVSCLPGRHPLRSLAAACAPVLGLTPEALRAQLEEAPSALARLAVLALGTTQGLVVFVDQLEEWVTFAEPTEAALAARALAALSDGVPGLRVLASARVDLLSRLATLPALGPELSRALFLLGPVQAEQLERVVVGPAEAFDVRFESSAMVAQLVDFAAQGGALPLLQFALAQLWAGRGTSNVLTEASLKAMGGVEGALARHADAVLARLPAEQRAAAQRLLVALVSGEDRRRRRPESELVHDEVSRAALASLADARLVLARDAAEGTVWELAHEALVREWPTLAQWLHEDRDVRVWQERLATATAEWLRLGRTGDALWTGQRLTEATRLLEHEAALTVEGREFLAASRRLARVRRWRTPLLAAALALSVGGTLATARWVRSAELRRAVDARLVTSAEHLRESTRAHASFDDVRRRALGAFDEGDFARGEEVWAQVLDRRADWLRALRLAQVELEAAQLLDATHADLPTRLLATAEQRLAYDEATGQEPELATELRRLSTLGATPEQLAPFTRPATVRLEVSPPGAQVTLARYVDLRTRARLEPASPLEVDRAVPLAPGSYRLTASAPGHHPAALPFVARRGEAVTLTLRLLPAGAVPEGYVHVPAGATLVGSGGDESVRREFYEAAPLHAVTLGDFLIGRHEVTFREYLAFLDALPEAARLEHTPRLEANVGAADTGRLSLTRDRAGWRLRFTPVTSTFETRAGELLRYPERERNASQDWLDFPVVGVSPEDAEVYLAWLDRTGRVPGARLCTEYEWERATRGADGRTLPHGEVTSPDDANLDETYGRRDAAYGPDAVGLHPASRSPFDVDDLLGNVWEMVRPTARDRPWSLKGGSWQIGTLSARAPNQWVINRGYRQAETGLRVCASVR